MGFNIPALQPYNFYVYSTAPGGGRTNVSQQSDLTANSQFFTRANDIAASYGINVAPDTNRLNESHYFTVNANQGLNQVSINNAPSYTQNLSFTGDGEVRVAPVPKVAPGVPSDFVEYLNSLNISEANMAALLNQLEFKLPGIGMGLRVTTDGAGNVVNVDIDPSMRGVRGEDGAFDPGFTLMNRAEVLNRATLQANPAADIIIENNAQARAEANPDARLFNDIPLGLSRLGDVPGIFRTQGPDQGLNPLFGANATQEASNPFLDRLAQLQPIEQGLSVTGIESDVSADAARRVATGQAGLDVGTSDSFKQSLGDFLKKAIPNNGAYNTQAQVRIADGTIPMAPALPLTAKSGAETTGMMAMDNGLTLSANIEDTANKKGSGGYIPFQLSGGNAETGSMGTGTGTGSPFQNPQSFDDNPNNPFGTNQQGQPNQEQLLRRRPLAFMA